MVEPRVEKINEHNKQQVLDYAKSDVIKHVFVFYDIQYMSEHTTVHAVFKDRNPIGYILVYDAMEFPSVVLECEANVADILVKYAPENRFIMHAPPNLLPIIKRKFPDGKEYVESWMLARKGEANTLESGQVRRLSTKEDAFKLLRLLENRKDRNPAIMKRYVDWMTRMPLYGFFLDNELVSYAGSFIQLPQVWMIGGVYTNPEHRNKGYATLATSAITREALNNAEAAALFVRSDNYPAIKAYEKIGYRKIGEKLWVDVGTGHRP